MPVVLMLLIVLTAFPTSLAHAWAATGHHVIAVLAFDLLSAPEQAEVMRILSAHPDFEKRFQPPDGITDQRSIDRWRIGVAGCWPDLVRRSAQDRPTWHYANAGTQLVGAKEGVNPPTPPGPLPSDATLATKDLYIDQAFELCRNIYRDTSQPDADRAIALCWLCHLVADGHQPCHAGSLYAAKVFPDGDRGGNSIKIASGNLHSTWDGLLGGTASSGDVLRRVVQLKNDKSTVGKVVAQREAVDPERWVAAEAWLAESRDLGRRFAYTPEVLEPVAAAARGLIDDVKLTKLSDKYLTDAGRVARIRATQAGYRLADVISTEPAK